MMNEPKKSDLAKVAGKPTNKAGSRTAAEPVEPRAGAEGNANQQSTNRTQCRARVSQALERVRQAARLRKQERFTALLHHINLDLLRMSFYALKRSAAPGVDGVTWQDYEACLESNLQGLHERVHRARTGHCLAGGSTYETGWATAAARYCFAGGQGTPASGGGGAECDLRGRFSRVFVWIPTEAQSARRLRRADGRYPASESELDTRCRLPKLFRRGKS